MGPTKLSDISRERLEQILVEALRRLDGTLYLDRRFDPRPREQVILDGEGTSPCVELVGHLTAREAIEILTEADDGSDPLVAWDSFEAVYAGNVRYVTRTGHAIEVFNDCGDWDYVDSVKHADGRIWDFTDGGARDREHPGDWRPAVQDWKRRTPRATPGMYSGGET